MAIVAGTFSGFGPDRVLSMPLDELLYWLERAKEYHKETRGGR